MAHKKVYWGAMQGTEERCSATILQQLTKEDTEQTCRENNTGKNYNNQKSYTIYLMDRRHTLRHTLGQNKPQLNGKGLLHPGREGAEVAVLLGPERSEGRDAPWCGTR